MCKLLRMSLLCLLLLFMFCTSCSFASVYYPNQFTQLTYNGNLYDFANQLMVKSELGKTFEEFVGWVSTSGLSSSSKTNFINWTNEVIDVLASPSTYNVYILIKPHVTNYNAAVIEFYFNNSSLTNKFDYIGFGYHKSNGTPYVDRQRGTGAKDPYIPTTGTGYNSWLWNKSNYFAANANTIASPSNNLKYTSYKNSTFNVNINGDTTHNFVKADYNITDSINIGYLTNYQYFDEVQGHLAVYSGTSNVDNANYWDQIASFQYIKDVGFYNNKLGFNKNTGVITIPPNVLQYDHGYSLWFDADNNNGTEDYNQTEEVFYFVVPLGSSATSGDINSDNPTGVDFDFINSVEYLTQFSSGNTEFIANNLLPPGDGSGDIFGFTYIDHDQWGFGDFIRVTFNNFLNVLYDYTDISYDMGLLGVHNSSEFITPSDNALITIVSLFCNCFLLMSSISWFFFTICSIGVLDVDKIIKDKADLGLF